MENAGKKNNGNYSQSRPQIGVVPFHFPLDLQTRTAEPRNL